MNVVVIGAGLYGAAVAAALTKRGATVTVVDAGAPGGGTSGATFSWINSGGKQPRAYHDLNVAGMEAHRKMAGDWYHETGNLDWVAGDTERLRNRVAGLHHYGYEAHWLSRKEVLRLEPDIDPAALPDNEIAFFPREAWIEPTRMIAHLLTTAAEVIRGDAVTGLDVTDRVRWVQLASGRRIDVDAVVNCAGPQAGEIAELAGLTFPMRNKPGVLVYTSPVAVSVSQVIHAPNVHLRPDGGGRLCLHGKDDDDPANVLAAACEVYPGIRGATIESVRVGNRPIPLDRMPVLGRVAKLPNFHFAVSHSAATLSVHVGDLVAAEVLGEDRSAELAQYRFERL
ncbi:FAD-binding oxidoreductase [Kibdelosporangium philippinense]|uniref:FAD-binding oxidoreductase n=1 Tax=Kibdelosporangium philippinense TaxID=211113 RepID=A0ABS8ZLU5_9PSEU|nr:FAD-dependent oxidoreductase [Kibdelosporangium philippinense]MCE7008128.1 FAD-binding oxidoreductase [Kibdelosporangium philippinense]